MVLKKKIGQTVKPSLDLPDVHDDGQLKVYPLQALDKRLVKRNNTAVTQLLIQWANMGPENATWEDFSVLQSQFPDFDPWGQGSSGAGGIVTIEVEGGNCSELGHEIEKKEETEDDGVLGSRRKGANDSVLASAFNEGTVPYDLTDTKDAREPQFIPADR